MTSSRRRQQNRRLLDRSPTSRRTRVAVVPVGLTVGALLVWQSSSAGFSAPTANSGSTFLSGTVSLTDDDTGSAMFSAAGLKPGSTGQKCIAVTYGGSVASSVKVYVTSGGLTGSGLGAYLSWTIEEGAPGSFSSCSTFAASATDYGPALLSSFASTSTNYATAVGTWTPTAAGQSMVYRFSWTLVDDEAARSKNAQVSFTWEARNT